MTSVTKVLFSIKNRNVYTCTQQITLFTLYTSQILRFLRQKLALINLNIKSRTILIASISNKALLNLRINADPFTKVIPFRVWPIQEIKSSRDRTKDLAVYVPNRSASVAYEGGASPQAPLCVPSQRGGAPLILQSYPSLPFKALSDQVLH